jgi:hypothetical protein
MILLFIIEIQLKPISFLQYLAFENLFYRIINFDHHFCFTWQLFID